MAQIDDLPPLRDVIRRHGLSAKKSLGQNFLLDLNLTARIARAGGALDEGDAGQPSSVDGGIYSFTHGCQVFATDGSR